MIQSVKRRYGRILSFVLAVAMLVTGLPADLLGGVASVKAADGDVVYELYDAGTATNEKVTAGNTTKPSYFKAGDDSEVSTSKKTNTERITNLTVDIEKSQYDLTGKVATDDGRVIKFSDGAVKTDGSSNLKRAVKFTTSSSSDVLVYAMKKPHKNGNGTETANLCVYTADADGKLKKMENGTIIENAKDGLVIKGTKKLSESGTYWIGFDADGGYIWYLSVTEHSGSASTTSTVTVSRAYGETVTTVAQKEAVDALRVSFKGEDNKNYTTDGTDKVTLEKNKTYTVDKLVNADGEEVTAYEITSVKVGDDDPDTEAPFEITPADAAVSIQVTIDRHIPTYKVTFKNGTADFSEEEVKEGECATEPDPTPTSETATFLGWTTDGADVEGNEHLFNFSTPITGNTTLYAVWKPFEYVTVSFDLNGGTGTAPDQQVIKDYGKVTKPTDPTRVSYSFDGWYTTDGDEKAFDFENDTVSKNITLTAKWVELADVEVVTFKSGTDFATVGTKNVNAGSTIDGADITPAAIEGKKFKYWYAEGSETEDYFAKAAADRKAKAGETLTLYAKYVDVVTVSFDLGYDGATGTPDDIEEVEVGTTPSSKPADPTRTGYTFKGWFTAATAGTEFLFEAKDTTPASTITVGMVTDGNVTLHAQWTANEYKVSFNANGGAAVTPMADITVTYGEAAQDLPANTYTNGELVFGGWATSEANAAARVVAYADQAKISNITENITLYAIWKNALQKMEFVADKYVEEENPALETVGTYSANGFNFVDYKIQLRVNNDTEKVPEQAVVSDDEKYSYAMNSGGSSQPKNETDKKRRYVEFTTSKPAKLRVVFESRNTAEVRGFSVTKTKPTSNISASANTGDYKTDVVKAVEDIELATAGIWYIVPYSNISFYYLGVEANDGTYPGVTYTVTTDLGYVPDGGSRISVQEVPAGTILTLDDPAERAGWTFDGWTIGDTTTALPSDYSVQGNVTIKANWTQIDDSVKYTVTFHPNNGEDNIVKEVSKYAKVEVFDDPTWTGKNFYGWYTNDTFTTAFDFDTKITANMDVYAQWNDPSIMEIRFDELSKVPAAPYNFKYAFTFGGGEIAPDTKATGYTKALEMGAGDATQNYVKFATTGAAKITVVVRNGSSTATTNDAVVGDADGNVYREKEGQYFAKADTTTIHTRTIYVPSAGDWYLYTTAGKGYFYKVKVEAVETHTITFNANGGTGDGMDAMTIITGDTAKKLTKNTYTKEGYVFGGWAASTTDAEAGTVLYADEAEVSDLTEDVTLYAIWKVGYKVTFVTSNATTDAVDVEAGKTVAKPADPVRDGYKFYGWYTKDADGNLASEAYTFEETPVNESFSLYAKWVKLYTVSFVPDNGTTIPAQTVEEGKTATAPAANPVKEGYTFKGWYTKNADGEFSSREYNFRTAVTGDIVLYAKWIVGEDVGEEDGTLTAEFVLVSDDASAELVEYNSENEHFEHVYTGAKIMPAIKVTNGTKKLTEGVDYTVKYSNNVNYDKNGKPAVVTITGKGNYTGKVALEFFVTQKSLAEEDENPVKVGNTTIAENTKAAPVLTYNGLKLSAKDYVLTGNNANVKLAKLAEGADPYTIKIEAKAGGNYKDSREVEINVVEKAKLKKIKVDLAKTISKDTRFVYDGTPKTLTNSGTLDGNDGDLTVYDAADKSKKALAPLNDDNDENYVISYSANVNAGTVKVTVVGCGAYTGTVTKSFKIQPNKTVKMNLALKQELDEKDHFTFRKAGVKPVVTITCTLDGEDVVLREGVDFKVSYANNKKVSTAKSGASYTVTYLGNYKGHAADKKVPFTIDQAEFNESDMKVTVYDMPYNVKNKKASKYFQQPYVELNGELLAKNEYTVTYEVEGDNGEFKPITKNEVLPQPGTDDGNDTVIKVVVTPKSANYKAVENEVISETYHVYYTTKTDISKAKITLVSRIPDKTLGKKTSKVYYTGSEIDFDPDNNERQADLVITLNRVEYKYGDKNGHDIADFFDVQYVNNVNKGKATIIITAKDGADVPFTGSKTGTFTIASVNLTAWALWMKWLEDVIE